jgi:hypothetical protein
LFEDISNRVKGRVQITTDQLRTYLNVIEDAFGAQADFAQLPKSIGLLAIQTLAILPRSASEVRWKK